MAKEEEKKEKKPGTDFGIFKGIFGGLTDVVDSVTSLILGKKEKETTEKEEKKKNSQQGKE